MPTLVADRDMIEWVFHELFENARRHRDRAEPVTVVVEAVQDGDRCLVTVTDDGGGIPAGRHEEAFGEGAVLDRSGGGLGLGLAIRSEEHTSELQSLMRISYAVFCLKK